MTSCAHGCRSAGLCHTARPAHGSNREAGGAPGLARSDTFLSSRRVRAAKARPTTLLANGNGLQSRLQAHSRPAIRLNKSDSRTRNALARGSSALSEGFRSPSSMPPPAPVEFGPVFRQAFLAPSLAVAQLANPPTERGGSVLMATSRQHAPSFRLEVVRSVDLSATIDLSEQAAEPS